MVAADSFVYLLEDIFIFFKGNKFHEDAGGRALVQVVADENETLAALLVFLNSYREIRKRTEIPL